MPRKIMSKKLFSLKRVLLKQNINTLVPYISFTSITKTCSFLHIYTKPGSYKKMNIDI